MCRRVPAEPALRIVVSTWNVAQTAPPAEGLGEWLGAGAGADIHAVALQEVVELDSALSYCRCCAGGGLSRQAAAWEAAVSAELGSLERVASVQLVGMVLLVYVSPSLAPHVAVEAQMAGTGPLRFGNKGAVGEAAECQRQAARESSAARHAGERTPRAEGGAQRTRRTPRNGGGCPAAVAA